MVPENGLSWDLCVKDDARFGGNFAADIHCRQVVFVWFEVVLSTSDVATIERVVQLLSSLGEAHLLDDTSHQQRLVADDRLRVAKEEQQAGLAAAKDVVSLARELVVLRGDGGSARKRHLTAKQIHAKQQERGRKAWVESFGWCWVLRSKVRSSLRMLCSLRRLRQLIRHMGYAAWRRNRRCSLMVSKQPDYELSANPFTWLLGACSLKLQGNQCTVVIKEARA